MISSITRNYLLGLVTFIRTNPIYFVTCLKYLVLAIFLAVADCLHAQTDSVYLWTNEVPGESKLKSAPVLTTVDDCSIRVVEVTNPFLAVFPPKASYKNGKSIIVCPGGGYVRLAIHKEGYTIANWLTAL